MSNSDLTLDVSAKNTKNEILEAYQSLLSKINQTKEITVQDVKKKKSEEEV